MKPWSRTGCWMLALGIAATAMARRPEPNAFLNKPAHSTEEFVRQVKSDAQVMDRYMRHYGMTREQVLALLSGLRLATLREDTLMTVFNCSEQDGAIRSRPFVIKAGAWVYVDKNGTPVAKKTCGNPFWTSPPAAPTDVEVDMLPNGLRDSQIAASVELMPAAELVEPPFEVPEPLALVAPHIELPGTEEVFSTPSRKPSPWPWLLAAFALDPPTGGGGRLPKRHIHEPPVPGPAAALAFAAPALAAWRRRRNPKV